MPPEIFTIGHSIHGIGPFIALIAAAGVDALGDVRSAPYSRHAPQFNAPALASSLAAAGIRYVPLGAQLGGKPPAPVAEFEAGLDRVTEGAARFRLCLMCAEADPLGCHRCRLVGRQLHRRGVVVRHILADGRQLTQGEIEERLLAGTEGDLFADREQRLALAYRRRRRALQ